MATFFKKKKVAKLQFWLIFFPKKSNHLEKWLPLFSGEVCGRVLDSHQFSQFRGCSQSQSSFGTLFYSTSKQCGWYFDIFNPIYWAFQCYLKQQLHNLPLFWYIRWHSVSGSVSSGWGFPILVSTLLHFYSGIVCSGVTLSLGWCSFLGQFFFVCDQS